MNSWQLLKAWIFRSDLQAYITYLTRHEIYCGVKYDVDTVELLFTEPVNDMILIYTFTTAEIKMFFKSKDYKHEILGLN